MHSLFLGIAIFPCCGKPHTIMASREPRAVCEANFAQVLHAAEPGHGGPALQAMLVEVPALQFLEIEAMYHDLPLPEINVLRVTSLDELKTVLGLINPDGTVKDVHDAPEWPQ